MWKVSPDARIFTPSKVKRAIWSATRMQPALLTIKVCQDAQVAAGLSQHLYLVWTCSQGWWGNLCEHYTEANTSTTTRVSRCLGMGLASAENVCSVFSSSSSEMHFHRLRQRKGRFCLSDIVAILGCRPGLPRCCRLLLGGGSQSRDAAAGQVPKSLLELCYDIFYLYDNGNIQVSYSIVQSSID